MATSSSILGAIGNLPRSIPRNLPTRSPGPVQRRPAPNIAQANALLAAQKAAAQRAQIQNNRTGFMPTTIGGIFGRGRPLNPRIPRPINPGQGLGSFMNPNLGRPPMVRPMPIPMPRDRAFTTDIIDGMNAQQRFLKNNIGSIFGPRPKPKPPTKRLPRRRVQPTRKAVDPNRRDRSRRATAKKKPINVTELRRKAGTLPKSTNKPLPRRRATPVKKALGPRGPRGPKGPGGPKSVRKPMPRRRVVPKTRTSTTNNQRSRALPRRRVIPRRR